MSLIKEENHSHPPSGGASRSCRVSRGLAEDSKPFPISVRSARHLFLCDSLGLFVLEPPVFGPRFDPNVGLFPCHGDKQQLLLLEDSAHVNTETATTSLSAALREASGGRFHGSRCHERR